MTTFTDPALALRQKLASAGILTPVRFPCGAQQAPTRKFNRPARAAPNIARRYADGSVWDRAEMLAVLGAAGVDISLLGDPAKVPDELLHEWILSIQRGAQNPQPNPASYPVPPAA